MVRQLLEALKPKQKGGVAKISNTEVENLFKQGEFITNLVRWQG